MSGSDSRRNVLLKQEASVEIFLFSTTGQASKIVADVSLKSGRPKGGGVWAEACWVLDLREGGESARVDLIALQSEVEDTDRSRSFFEEFSHLSGTTCQSNII